MFKTKKLIAFTLVIAMLASVLGISLFGNQTFAKKKNQSSVNVKTKTIGNLGIGDKYQLKYKKGLKYKSSDKKVATVTKKGKIVARGYGECVINVRKKEKLTKKYKVRCLPPPMTATAHVIIDHIEKIDDELSYVYGIPNEDQKAGAFGVHKKGVNGIDMLKIITKNSDIDRLNASSGDYVIYIYSYGVEKKIEGNILIVFGNGFGLAYNKGFVSTIEPTCVPQPTPTATPEPTQTPIPSKYDWYWNNDDGKIKYFPGQISLKFYDNNTSIETVASILKDVEVEEIKELGYDNYQYFLITLADKSDDTLYKTIVSLDENRQVAYADISQMIGIDDPTW